MSDNLLPQPETNQAPPANPAAPPRGMAVVAGVWGFWDIIAGLTLAGWWGRRPAQIPPADTLREQRT